MIRKVFKSYFTFTLSILAGSDLTLLTDTTAVKQMARAQPHTVPNTWTGSTAIIKSVVYAFPWQCIAINISGPMITR